MPERVRVLGLVLVLVHVQASVVVVGAGLWQGLTLHRPLREGTHFKKFRNTFRNNR